MLRQGTWHGDPLFACLRGVSGANISRMKPDTKLLISRLGGPSAVGKAIGRTHSAVCQWGEIPSEYLVQLETYSIGRGFPVLREEMRPDLYDRTPNIDVTS